MILNLDGALLGRPSVIQMAITLDQRLPKPYSSILPSSSSKNDTTYTEPSDTMNALYEVQPTGGLPVGYPHDPMFDGLSRQMDLSQTTRRLSRNSNGQRSGTAMRVTKPSSTNSSPRSSATVRRRTLMNDGNAQRRRQQVLEQMSMYYGSQDEQPSKQRERPVSWHPNSYGQPQTQPQSSYYLSTPAMYVDQQDMYATCSQYSPLMASYSCNTSPSATYSPLALPFHSADSLQYFPTEGKTYTQASSLYPTSTPNQYVPETYLKNDSRAENTCAWDWNAFIMHGFNTTTPPTPEAFPQTQLSQPVLSEESLPYEPLEEPEEEGEILVGMGLYDTPDKYDEDPQLNNYRSTVSSLLGSSFRPEEPKGKGLKLEETWEPPKSEDEEEEDEDEDSSD